ncbi:MAG: hypothetical protein IJ598_01045 [Ruminococcus sp.]|nr:hypothetical protein [Ruminococcus sp.]
MDLNNYQLSEYEEYLLERTGTENVAFTDGMVYVTYHRNNNSTELMKSNDDEFIMLCMNAKEQVCSLQEHKNDDDSEWLDCIRFPVDSTERDEFEKMFYQQNPDIEPQPKNNPLSGSKVTLPLGETLFEFVYADFDSLYEEVKVCLCLYKDMDLPNADNEVQEMINRYRIYRNYKWLINHLAFGSTASALFPPAITQDADLAAAMLDYYKYLIMLQKEYRDILEFCFETKYYSDVLSDMTPSVRYYLYRKINNMPPFVEFNEEQRLIMGDKKAQADYDFSAFSDFAQEHGIDTTTLIYFHNFNHNPVLRYRCESLHEFLELELSKLIEYDVKLKCCKRCGQWFTYKGNYDARYCNRIHLGELRSCRDLAAEENYKLKMEKNEALPIYRKYYRRYYARVKVNQIKNNDFKKWKYKALVKRDECSAGNITTEEYIDWLEGYFPNRKRKDK